MAHNVIADYARPVTVCALVVLGFIIGVSISVLEANEMYEDDLSPNHPARREAGHGGGKLFPHC